LGKKLYLRVQDLGVQNEKPAVTINQTLREVIVIMTAGRLGVTAVVNEADQLVGIITDGDLRRLLDQGKSIDGLTAADVMTKNPVTISPDELAVSALDLLRKKKITQIAIAENQQYLGIIHIHDLLREGLL
jgi:arabinose-5-phosphate isomerase